MEIQSTRDVSILFIDSKQQTDVKISWRSIVGILTTLSCLTVVLSRGYLKRTTTIHSHLEKLRSKGQISPMGTQFCHFFLIFFTKLPYKFVNVGSAIGSQTNRS